MELLAIRLDWPKTPAKSLVIPQAGEEANESLREFYDSEIMQGTFDLKVDEYKQVKSLARENLRDHMTDIELILTMLAEATTTKLHRDRVHRAWSR